MLFLLQFFLQYLYIHISTSNYKVLTIKLEIFLIISLNRLLNLLCDLFAFFRIILLFQVLHIQQQTLQNPFIDSLASHSFLMVNFDRTVEILNLSNQILSTPITELTRSFSMISLYLLLEDCNFSLMLLVLIDYLLLQLGKIVFYFLLTFYRYLLIINYILE